VNDTFSFQPPQRTGVLFHLVSIFFLIVLGSLSLYRIANAEVGQAFMFYLIPIVLAIPLVPLLIYRLSYLQNAVYTMERDSIRLQWGLRVEVIPTNTILWVRRDTELAEPIRYPWIRWPGAVLGLRRLSREMPIEFMASTTRDLILIATYEKVFAISPGDPEKFLNSYQRLTELGSLLSPQPESVSPATLIVGVWKNPASRNLILLGVFLGFVLIAWVARVAPTRPVLSLGFLPSGEPRAPIPGVRLVLLPILNTIGLVVNLFAGLVLFRRNKHRPLAYLLWGNSVLVSGLFLVATYFILRTG